MTGLEGKVALVTGGSRGIGAAVARRLARDGADVAITYASAAESAAAVVASLRELGRRAIAIQADSANPQAVTDSVRRTVDQLGRLDIVVNNAGIFPYQPLDEVTLDTFDRAMAIHVRAAFVAAQAAARHMEGGGRIVNIGSCLGERTGGPNMTVYAASKAALVGLSKGLAQDLGPHGITVNVVHPGPIDTDMNPADAEGAELQRAGLPLGRFGEADDVAAMVALLAGEQGRFVTGTAISVDGGFSA